MNITVIEKNIDRAEWFNHLGSIISDDDRCKKQGIKVRMATCEKKSITGRLNVSLM